jgi:hypothetical protein
MLDFEDQSEFWKPGTQLAYDPSGYRGPMTQPATATEATPTEPATTGGGTGQVTVSPTVPASAPENNQWWPRWLPTRLPGGPGGPAAMEAMAMVDYWLKRNVYPPNEWLDKGIMIPETPTKPFDPAEPISDIPRPQTPRPETIVDTPPEPHVRTEDNVSVRGQCRFITICFDSKGYDAKEYARQLRMQQSGINAMTPSKWLANRTTFEIPGMPQMLRKMSKPYQDVARLAYEDEHGVGSAAGLAALHRVDMVAGGDYFDIAGMGDANVNSSMGPSWNGQRVERLKADALEQQKNNCPSVMVKLSSDPNCLEMN